VPEREVRRDTMGNVKNNKASVKKTRELAEVLAKHAPEFEGKSTDDAETTAGSLRRLAIRMHKLAEVACCRDTTDGEKKEDEENDESFRRLCSSIGCRANISGDPRGYVAHIVFPDGHHNTWGGAEHGYGID
jgi:hypothetical protein